MDIKIVKSKNIICYATLLKISCFYTTLDIFSKRNYLNRHGILLTDGFKRTSYLTNEFEQSHLIYSDKLPSCPQRA